MILREMHICEPGDQLIKLSDHFTAGEFRSDSETGIWLVDPVLVERLEKMRTEYGKSIRVNSGFRSVVYNRQIGGVANSQHLYGFAADLHTELPTHELAGLAYAVGFRAIGLYKSFVHVDTRAGNAFWGGNDDYSHTDIPKLSAKWMEPPA